MYLGSIEYLLLFGSGSAPASSIVGTVLFTNETLNGVTGPQGITKAAPVSKLLSLPFQPVANASALVYEADLVDLAGNKINAGELSTLTLSLTVMGQNGAPINGVTKRNILNTDRGVLNANGHLTITLNPGDTGFSVSSNVRETRSMTIDLTWPGAASPGTRHEVQFEIVGLSGQ